MDREIKFRAFHKGHMMTIDEMKWLLNGRLTHINRLFDVFTDDVAVMQYTGLKDKNGKDIYEFDFLYTEMGDVTEVVKFGEYCSNAESYDLGWYKESIHHQDLTTSLLTGSAICEVIGNIYQDSHLLTSSEGGK